MGPAELTQLGLNRELFKRSDSKSWKGPCIFCGGTDRFRVFTWQPWPHWWSFCNHCGWKGWPDQLNPSLREHSFSAELKLEWDRIRREEQEKQAGELLSRRKAFAKSRVWEIYHSKLNQQHRQTLRQWGIDDSWQDYLQIGFVARKYYWNESMKVSPAISFPYFGMNREPITMQYRLMAEGIEDRYRFEKGLGTSFYNPTPDEPIGEDVLIVEGVKKSIAVKILGRLNLTVLAVPSRSDFGGIEKAIVHCVRKWVLLDPDAITQCNKLASRIDGKGIAHLFNRKVDDMLLEAPCVAWKMLREAVS